MTEAKLTPKVRRAERVTIYEKPDPFFIRKLAEKVNKLSGGGFVRDGNPFYVKGNFDASKPYNIVCDAGDEFKEAAGR